MAYQLAQHMMQDLAPAIRQILSRFAVDHGATLIDEIAMCQVQSQRSLAMLSSPRMSPWHTRTKHAGTRMNFQAGRHKVLRALLQNCNGHVAMVIGELFAMCVCQDIIGWTPACVKAAPMQCPILMLLHGGSGCHSSLDSVRSCYSSSSVVVVAVGREGELASGLLAGSLQSCSCSWHRSTSGCQR